MRGSLDRFLHSALAWYVLLAATFGLVIRAEVHGQKSVRELKAAIAEDRFLAGRAAERAETLRREIVKIREDLDECGKLPVRLSADVEQLKAAVDQSALQSGVTCAVTVISEDKEKVTLEVMFSASTKGLFDFLGALLARGELFSIESFAMSNDSGTVDVEMKLSASLKGGEA